MKCDKEPSLDTLNMTNETSPCLFLETGKVVPIIDRHYPLNETTEALWYFGEGHARGKAVITMGCDKKIKRRKK